MATEKNQPLQQPDAATSYGRERPEHEAGMGQTKPHDPPATPHAREDKPHQTVNNAQEPRQINAHEVVNEAAGHRPKDGKA